MHTRGSASRHGPSAPPPREPTSHTAPLEPRAGPRPPGWEQQLPGSARRAAPSSCSIGVSGPAPPCLPKECQAQPHPSLSYAMRGANLVATLPTTSQECQAQTCLLPSQGCRPSPAPPCCMPSACGARPSSHPAIGVPGPAALSCHQLGVPGPAPASHQP
uniref:Uncharacterized protein n=1 Tax=Gopherus evgoodei TaxID=1825980 RepID=A0A8C4VLY5_9SAUR